MVTVNETNREPDGTFETLEATDSITDPEGNTVTSLSDPVRVTEDAVTFAESDVILTLNGTVLNDNSIEIGFDTGPTVSREDDLEALDGDFGEALQINPNRNLSGLAVTVSSLTGPVQDVFIADQNRNILAEATDGYTAGDTVRLQVELSQGTDYLVGVYDDGDNFEYGRNINTNYPYTGTDLDITGCFLYAHPDDDSSLSSVDQLRAVNDISGLKGDQLSGNVVVEWDSGTPEPIQSYDLVTFVRTLDGETVRIDVENGDGNVLFSDIDRNFDISAVDVSKNVTLRANLLRSSTTNNPTLDYAARRFTR